MNTSQQFWIIFDPKAPGHSTRAYLTKDHAQEHAEELAAANPFRKYFVLEAVGLAYVEQPVKYIDLKPALTSTGNTADAEGEIK